MTGATIRRVGPDSAADWRAIRLTALGDAPEAFASRLEDWAARPLADFAAQCGANPTFLAFEGAMPVGSAVWMPDSATEGRAWLAAVYLLPEARGRGLGQALIAAVIEDARAAGIRDLWLEVAAGSRAAQAAYRRAGFAETTLPDGLRRCASDDKVMRRSLV